MPGDMASCESPCRRWVLSPQLARPAGERPRGCRPVLGLDPRPARQSLTWPCVLCVRGVRGVPSCSGSSRGPPAVSPAVPWFGEGSWAALPQPLFCSGLPRAGGKSRTRGGQDPARPGAHLPPRRQRTVGRVAATPATPARPGHRAALQALHAASREAPADHRSRPAGAFGRTPSPGRRAAWTPRATDLEQRPEPHGGRGGAASTSPILPATPVLLGLRRARMASSGTAGCPPLTIDKPHQPCQYQG